MRTGDTKSEVFQCNKGVRQGCPLSPVLFCLYISDLFHFIGTRVEGFQIHEEIINGLLYADDAVLLAKGVTQMEEILMALKIYCDRWRLQVNTDETKVIQMRPRLWQVH